MGFHKHPCRIHQQFVQSCLLCREHTYYAREATLAQKKGAIVRSPPGFRRGLRPAAAILPLVRTQTEAEILQGVEANLDARAGKWASFQGSQREMTAAYYECARASSMLFA
jgi:hypothetical protein